MTALYIVLAVLAGIAWAYIQNRMRKGRKDEDKTDRGGRGAAMNAQELLKMIAGIKHKIDRKTVQAKRQAARVETRDRVREMHKAGK